MLGALRRLNGEMGIDISFACIVIKKAHTGAGIAQILA